MPVHGDNHVTITLLIRISGLSVNLSLLCRAGVVLRQIA